MKPHAEPAKSQTDEVLKLRSNLAVKSEELQRQTARAEKLQAALERYAWHEQECPLRDTQAVGPAWAEECTCGLAHV